MRYLYNLLQQFFAFLLNTTDKYVGNFGISIIIVTILIKIALLPLTLKQDKSMKEMKKLQPELEKIKQKYANDKQMLNIKTMEPVSYTHLHLPLVFLYDIFDNV